MGERKRDTLSHRDSVLPLVVRISEEQRMKERKKRKSRKLIKYTPTSETVVSHLKFKIDFSISIDLSLLVTLQKFPDSDSSYRRFAY